jgi:hypothetical protein
MGADVHGWLEQRYTRHDGSFAPWRKVEKIDDSRNYSLFAALANVRNDGSITPFGEPRGLPEDYVPFEGKDCEEHGAGCEGGDDSCYRSGSDWWATTCDGHSLTWFTLDELINWEGWDQVFHNSGWISKERYDSWDKLEVPYPYSGMVSGGGVIHAIEGQSYPEGWNYIRVEWTQSLRQTCDTWIKWMAYMDAKHSWSTAELRIVIGFDN